MGSYNDKEIQNVVDLILKDYEDERTINAIDVHHQPDKDVIISVVDNLLKILYPGYLSDKVFQVYTLKNTGIFNCSRTLSSRSNTLIAYHLCCSSGRL